MHSGRKNDSAFKRLLRRLTGALAAITVLLCPFYISAQEQDAPDIQNAQMEEALDAAGGEELEENVPDDARRILEENGVDGIDYQQLLSLSPGDFFKTIWQMVLERLGQPMKVFAALLGTVLLCSMLDSLKTAFSESSLGTVFAVVATVCVAAAVSSPIMDCISSTVQAVQDCAKFMLAFIPVFASVLTVSGQAVTATTYTMLLFGACELVAQIAAGILVPLMAVYLALCIAGSVTPGIQIGAAAKVIKSSVSWALGLLLTLFVALLSMQTLVSSGGDAALSKTTKFLIGSFIPVVGSALGEAFVATQGYMKLLKTTVGAFGVIVSMLTFLPIFLQTVVWYFTVNITSALSDMMGVRQVSELLKSAGAVLGVLLAVIFCFALLVIVSTSLVLLATGSG